MIAGFNINRFMVTLRTTKRYWIPVTLLGICAVNLVGLLRPKKFESQAIVWIHEPRMEQFGGGPVLTINDRLKSIREEMTSFSFLKKIASQLNLDAGLAPDSQEYDRLIRKMADSIELRVKEQDLFTVAYRSDTPEVARDVSGAIVEQYINNSNNYYENQTRSQVTLITAQLNEAQTSLEVARNKVVKFKNDHINETPESQEIHRGHINSLNAQVQTDQSRLDSLRSSIELAKTRLTNMERDTSQETIISQDPDLQALKSQKQAKNLELVTLLQSFTEKHWKVKETRAQIKVIDDQIQAAVDGAKTTTQVTKAPNKNYQELLDKLQGYEIEEKQLTASIQKARQNIAELQEYLNNIPKYQGEYDALINIQRNKEERVNNLMKKLDDARITGAIEKQGLGPSFDIMEHPRLSKIAVSPNRVKIGALSLIAGFMAGLGLVYIMTILDSAVRSVEEARTRLQMPVLGIVQRIVTAAEELNLRRRRRRRAIGLSASVSVVIAALVTGLMLYQEPIRRYVESVRNYLNK